MQVLSEWLVTTYAGGVKVLSDSDEIIRLQEQVKTLFTNQKDLRDMFEGVITKLDEMQKSFQNRLPPWATLLISVLTAACGWLAGR